MNKSILIFLLFSLIFGASCQAEQTAVSPTPVITATETGSGTAVSTPTLPATTTATPLPTATKTAVPTATSQPFTQGNIVFLWDQRAEPGSDGPGGFSPTDGLFQVIPGVVPEESHIQPLLTEKVINRAYLSPDQTKSALMVMEDIDGDGQYTTWDDYKIHVYHFADGSVIRLDNQETIASRYGLSWMPDNQAAIYPQSSNIVMAQLDGSLPEMLTDNPPDPIEGEPYIFINALVGSPDGSLFALYIDVGTGMSDNRWSTASRNLTLFDKEQKNIIFDFDTKNPSAGEIDMRWSFDSQWLAFTGDQNQGLSVVNAETLAVHQLVEPPALAFPVWSPNTSQLAFASDGKISIWNAESQAIQEVTSKDYVSEPAWSPDGSLIAAIYSEEGESGIVIVNPSAQSEEMLNNGVNGGQVIWSPDGEWLTGVWGSQKGFGLHVVDKDTGEVHLVLDTAGYPSPSSIMWLP